MSLSHAAHGYIVDAAKAAPPVAVTMSSITGLGLQQWVYIVTIIYTVLQILLLVRKHIKEN